jgi:3-dehydrosphinganine reductase
VTKLGDAHVLITGGSSGIGLETARLAVAHGARVSLVARDPERLAAAAASTGAAATASADVRDHEAVRAAFAVVEERAGPCDVLVTSAGASHPGYFAQLDDGVFRDQMEVDYFGTLHAVRAVVPSMIERGRGHLVTISSTAGLIGVFGYSAYAPAKFAVRGLAETLRPELAPHGIVVACAYPPDTRTPGFDAENALKPPETARISAAIKPRDAAVVAKAIVAGIEKDRLVITADVQTAALARAAGLLGPYVRRTMDRQVRAVRHERS